jgi:hypothetical protein
MTYQYSEDEEDRQRFHRNIDNSQPAVFVMAAWFSALGYEVTIPPTTKAPTHSQWKKHADNGDIFISKNGMSKKTRIEVKHLTLNAAHGNKTFTNKDDWPFPDYMVCAQHAFDMAREKPHSIFALNPEKTHAGVVYGKDHANWWTVKRVDSRYNNMEQSFYTTAPDLVTFIDLNQYLEKHLREQEENEGSRAASR